MENWMKKFLSQPRGFINPQFPTHVRKPEKATYGLEQDPRAWYNSLHEHLLKMHFVRTESDTSLFVWKHLVVTIYVLIYVDDIIITGNPPQATKFVINSLQKDFH